jgi:pimeloyl-ACP methyl ester carboxylesterase
MESRTFVLVHGAWHGGWCYSRVRKILARQGHEVFTPTLPGLGEHAHLFSPAINASTHIEDVARLIEIENLSNVILVGHSYGGLVITGVADRVAERIAALVYIDAFVGEDGKSCFDLDLPDFVASHVDRAQSHGGHTSPPFSAHLFGVNPADQTWVDSSCTPQPLATLAERIHLTGAYKSIVDKTYVFATGWTPSPFEPISKKIRDDPAWKFRELPCGHDTMVDMPEETAVILLSAAAAP